MAIENVLGTEGAGGHIIIIANEEISTQSLQKVILIINAALQVLILSSLYRVFV